MQIPEEVKLDLIGLAILEADRHRKTKAIQSIRKRLAAKMPRGVRVTNRGIQRLVREHNRRALGSPFQRGS